MDSKSLPPIFAVAHLRHQGIGIDAPAHHTSIYGIYIAPLQGNYSEVHIHTHIDTYRHITSEET